MKKLFAVFLFLSILLFGLIQWGAVLFGDKVNVQSAGELNAEKITLLDRPVANALPAATQTPLQPAVPASAPVPQAVAPVVPAPQAAAPAVLPPPQAAILTAPATVPPAIPAPVKAAVPVPAARSCMEWGEFAGTDLANAEKGLAALKLGERVSQRTVEYDSGYWVYIPPLKSKTAIQKKLDELKEAGFTEYFVLNKDAKKFANAISLGVFKSEEAARDLYKLARKKGFKTVKMGERKRKLKFVVFNIRDLDADAAAQLGKLQKDLPNSELKKIACINPK